MRFCPSCDNMLYIKVNNAKRLMYYCKNCNHSEEETTSSSVCVLDTNNVDEETNYTQYITPYLKYDLALPRDDINCVNQKCTKLPEQPNEVIYVKYDSDNMLYLYHCVYCEHYWRAK